eukprot:CAMPEP_0168721026 /NCGR_PEP_ID=MMETSP0724-20121128/1871_1 /TAXON_ID=265536 /ORGANISM="Amphiprora sp., Strain CCMP467" /LENGTH=821 /DNA_ID=CAMNT_0008767657 /DNA_START=288 /DNA_END=2754 /DNA_ORIENTATION=+
MITSLAAKPFCSTRRRRRRNLPKKELEENEVTHKQKEFPLDQEQTPNHNKLEVVNVTTMNQKEDESSDPTGTLQVKLEKLIQQYGGETCQIELEILLKGRRREQNETTTEQIPEKDKNVEEEAITPTMMAGSFDAVIWTDIQGVIQCANDTALNMFGTRDEGANDEQPHGRLVGRRLNELVSSAHQTDYDNIQEYWEKSLNNNDKSSSRSETMKIWNVVAEVTAHGAHGAFPARLGLRRLPSTILNNNQDQPQQQPITFVAYIHDQTEHRAQLRELKNEVTINDQEKQLISSILDSSMDVICLVDQATGQIQRINKSVVTEFGYDSPQELVGQHVCTLLGKDSACDYQQQYKEYFEKQQQQQQHNDIDDQSNDENPLLSTRKRGVVGRRKDETQFPCKIGFRLVPHMENVMVGFLHNSMAEEQAARLTQEKQAAEVLLANMLPTEIALKLKQDPTHIAEHFDKATVLFADIVGFTKLSNTLEPVEVVQFLNDLFTRFDNSLDKYKLNKIKTIGDCYMATSIPGCRDPTASCEAVCHFALDMKQQLEEYNKENPDSPLNLRIGINCGPVVAGVVGTKRFQYDIWGDAVNIASRMESTGEPGRVQVSQNVVDTVSDQEFVFEHRGSVSVKGIGEMETHFLNNRLRKRRRSQWGKLRSSVLLGGFAGTSRDKAIKSLSHLVSMASQSLDALVDDAASRAEEKPSFLKKGQRRRLQKQLTPAEEEEDASSSLPFEQLEEGLEFLRPQRESGMLIAEEQETDQAELPHEVVDFPRPQGESNALPIEDQVSELQKLMAEHSLDHSQKMLDPDDTSLENTVTSELVEI